MLSRYNFGEEFQKALRRISDLENERVEINTNVATIRDKLILKYMQNDTLCYVNSSKDVVAVTLDNIINETPKQTTVTKNLDNTITIGTIQDIDQTSAPIFSGLGINGDISVTGNVDGVDISSLNSAFISHTFNSTTAHFGQDLKTTGTPTFNKVTINTYPSINTDAATKLYVDTELKNVDWQNSIISIYDPTVTLPPLPSIGDRYVSATTGSGWTQNYIYEWNGTSWTETIPNDGYIVFVMGGSVNPRRFIFYNQPTLTWVFLDEKIDHQSLNGAGTYTHTQIDSHINNNTDAHFGQDLKITAEPTFNTVNVSTSPTETYHLVNKSYVDNVIQNIHWQKSIIEFYDPTSGLPILPSHGDRYISTANANSWITNRIYEWDSYQTLWIETVPSAGYSLYVEGGAIFPQTSITFNGVDWVKFGSTLDHTTLRNIGINTHAQIDSHINNNTDAHFGQDLKITASPSFSTLTITSTDNSTDISTGVLLTLGGLAVKKNLNANAIKIHGLIQSTDITTGTLVVSGGTGITNDVNIGGVTNIYNTSNSTDPTTGSIVTYGGLGISKNVNIGGTAKILSTAETTDTQTGSLIISGGSGISKNLYVGGSLNISQSSTLFDAHIISTENTTDSSTGSLIVDGGLYIAKDAIINNQISTSSIDTVIGNITSTINSSSTSTGALVVSGGLGIGEKLYVGDSIVSGGQMILEGDLSMTPYDIYTNNGYFDGIIRTTSTIASTSTSTGALIIAGGAGIGENLYVNNSLKLQEIAKKKITMTDAGNDYQFTGFGITSNNLRMQIADSTNQINFVAGLNTTSEQELMRINGGLDSNIQIYHTTQSTSTDTGSLIIDGGTGIGKNLNIGGNLEINGTATIPIEHVTTLINSSDVTTGSLRVDGGVGIGMNLNVGGILKIHNTINTTDTQTGSLQVLGGVSISKDVIINGITNINNTIQSTSTSTGSIIIDGGIGMQKSLYAGDGIFSENGLIIGHKKSGSEWFYIGDLVFDSNDFIEIVGKSKNTTTDNVNMIQYIAGCQSSGEEMYNNYKIMSGTNDIRFTVFKIWEGVTKSIYFETSTTNYGINVGQTFWQSFTATNNNYVIYFGHRGTTYALANVTYYLYEDEGLSGNLLHSYTTNLVNAGGSTTWFYTASLTRPYVRLTFGNKYTIAIKLNSLASGVSIDWNCGSGYAGGSSNIGSNSDFIFRVYTNKNNGGKLYTKTSDHETNYITNGTNITLNWTSGGTSTYPTGYDSLDIYYDTFVENPTINEELGGLTLYSATQSTDTQTGSLIMSGGLGMTGNLNVGGSINATGMTITGDLTVAPYDIYVNDLNSTGIITTTLTTESSSTSTGSLQIAGGVGINQLYVNTSINSLGTITSSSNIKTTSVEESSSLTTGALQISGGAGIGQLYVDGITTLDSNLLMGTNDISSVGAIVASNVIKTTSTIESTSTSSGSLLVAGGTGIAKNAYIGGNLDVTGIETIHNTIESTSTSTGSLIVDGGVSIVKNTYIGGNLDITGIGTINDTTESTSTSTGSLIISGGTSIVKNTYIGGNLDVTGNEILSGILNIDSSIESTSITTGSLITTGGIGIEQSIYCGNNIHLVGGDAKRIYFNGGIIDTYKNYNFGTYNADVINLYGTTSYPTSDKLELRLSDPTYTYSSNFKFDYATGDLELDVNQGGSSKLYLNPSDKVEIPNTTDATSITTGVLNVGGGVGITKNLYIGGNSNVTGIETINDTTESTSTSTGSLIVSGGTSIIKNTYIGGNLDVTGDETLSGILNINNSTESTSITTGSLVTNGGMGIDGNLYCGNNIRNLQNIYLDGGDTKSIYFNGGRIDTYKNRSSTHKSISYNADVISLSGTTSYPTSDKLELRMYNPTHSYYNRFIFDYVTSNLAIDANNLDLDVNDRVKISSTVNATSITTGTLIIGGGVGISRNLYVGGNLDVTGIETINNTTESTSTSTGSLILDGGLGIAKNLYVGGNETLNGILNINDTTQSTSTSTGSLILDGGLGIVKNTYIGGNLELIGIENLTNTTESTSTDSGSLIVSGGVGIAKNTYIGGDLNLTGVGTINDTTESTSTSTGSLIVSGGLGIAKNLYIGGNETLNGTLNIDDTTESTSISTGALIVDGGVSIAKNTRLGGNLDLTGIETINDTTESTSTSTGALIVSGGLGIAKNTYIGGNLDLTGVETINNTTESTSTSTGALVLSGGMGIEKKLYCNNVYMKSSVSGDPNININGTGVYDILNFQGTNATKHMYISIVNASAAYTILMTTIGGDCNLYISGTYVNIPHTLVTPRIYLNNGSPSATYNKNSIVHESGDTIIRSSTGGKISSRISTADETETTVFEMDASKSTFYNTTESTSTSTGSIQIAGGIGMAKNLYVGGLLNVSSTTTLGGNLNMSLYDITANDGNFSGVIKTTLATGSSDTNTGALLITGGVGIGENLNIGGTLSKGGGSFVIKHPDPSKNGWKLRHCFVETNTRGDNMYRYQIQTQNCKAIIPLPSYFKYLNENPQIFVCPVNSLSLGYGQIDELMETVTITVSKDALYNVLIIGTRKDELMKEYWDQYEDEIPPNKFK